MEVLEPEAQQGPGAYQTYLDVSSAPLTGFLFALPLFIVYHAGLWYLNTFSGLQWANAVDIAIAGGLARLGMAGPVLSFIFVVVAFLLLHALSGRAWRWPGAGVWLLMIVESLVLALPVFMLSRVVVKLVDSIPLSAVAASATAAASAAATDAAAGVDAAPLLSWRANLILSCGAGVYEEFFFRLVVMGLLALLFTRALGLARPAAFVLAGVLQALLFALSHHLPGGPEEIALLTELRSALPVISFRFAAGLYFALLYVERGFGVAAGAHAGYDLLVVMLDAVMPLEGA